MDEEVFQFTAEHFGVERKALSARTCPWPDLCQDEQQAEAFLWKFSKRFGVPFPSLNNRHSGAYLARTLASSVIGGISALTFGVLWFGKGSGDPGPESLRGFLDSSFPYLTLADLAAAATRSARHRESHGIRPHTEE